MANPLQVVEVATWHAGQLNALCSLLIDVVDDGASVGFLPPLRYADARLYWEHLFEPGVRLWVARYDGEVAGTIQLHLSMKQNGAHRAEIAKLMVHPQRRRLGIARQLMEVAEAAAVQAKRSLLTLDTRAGDQSNALYRSLSFVEAGRIPQYAQSADGQLHETVIYYKWLGESRRIDLSAQRSTSPGVLHHVEINVSNLHRSAEFWGWLLGYLGYEPYQQWPAGCSWRKGDTYIVLVQTESAYLEQRYHRKRTGLNHLAFHAESRDQVDELTRLLTSMGGHVLYRDSHPNAGGAGHYAVFFEDPDRIKLEVVAP